MFQTNVVEKTKTHISFSITFSDNRAVYGIMQKNTRAGEATDDNTIRRMRLAWWIIKATNTQNL